jgi:monooxygenase
MKHGHKAIARDVTPVTAHFDMIIVGAGLSGVCQAYHFTSNFPNQRYAILESRSNTGGTWDLFRYPGIRSDSDMPTLGFAFEPWISDKAIADGPDILDYIRTTAKKYKIDEHVQCRTTVKSVEWNTREACWYVHVEHQSADGAKVTQQVMTCNFLSICAGYYDYSAGYTPELPDSEKFKGPVIHPQFWPEDADWTGKKVVVIGSGATAITLLPRLADAAEKVTMLQRSPTYIVSAPAQDKLANWMRRWLGYRAAHFLTRWKNALVNIAFYQISQRRPSFMINMIRKGAVAELGPDFDVDRHFKPRYKPWDQRICLAPEGDFYKAIRAGKADVVTDQIAGFTATGIRLASGQILDADIIVTATGLKMRIAGGIGILVDGKPVNIADCFSYKGALYSGLPNFSIATGYTNAAWTMKCELIARYVVRLLRHMEANGYDYAVPQAPRADAPKITTFGLSSGYLERDRSLLPKQTNYGPWKLNQNYLKDFRLMRMGGVAEFMTFGRKSAESKDQV